MTKSKKIEYFCLCDIYHFIGYFDSCNGDFSRRKSVISRRKSVIS